MLILLGSKNPSKLRSLESALQELNINDKDIICIDANSNVPSKPIGYEIIRGAENRNNDCKKYAIKNSIEYDYVISLEGGYSLDENGLPFIVTYAVVEDKNGKKSTGKSLGLRLTRKMYEYVRNGYSLNSLIEQITDVDNNKQNNGITGYLSNGIFKRDKIDIDAVLSAFVPMIFDNERKVLDQKINLENNKHKILVKN